MLELRDLIQYRFNKDFLKWDVRKEICNNIEKEGFRTFGNCMDLELIKEVKYRFLDNKIIIISKIPVQNEVDNFKLTKVISLPVKINGGFYRVKNVDGRIAVGKIYKTRITECQEH